MMNEPTEIRAGDTTTWTETVKGYSSTDGWALKYRLTGVTQKYDLTSTGSGETFTVTLTSDASKDYVAGTYNLLGWVEKGAGATLERHTYSSSTVQILPNLATASAASDQRSFARLQVANLQTTLDALNKQLTDSISIAGRSAMKKRIAAVRAELTYWENRVKQEDRKERVAKGLRGGGSYKFSFGRTK